MLYSTAGFCMRGSVHWRLGLESLSEFFLALEVAPFDDGAAMSYGLVRASPSRRGRPIGPLDTLIAGHAVP
jgi:tRNA(fMet)-specific endonuclease VapC